MATVEARTKKLRAKNFDGIVGHQIAQISYWRLMINAALMLLDMTMFILASAVVLTWKNELVFHSARFGFSMPFAVYCLLAACIWVLCLRSMGVYHRHVMGDGYQLNVLMFKAIVECLIALCAFHFLLNMFMTLRSLVLIMLLTYALTVIERAIARRFIV